MRSFGTGRREQLILRVVVATLTLVLASVLWCAPTPFVFPLAPPGPTKKEPPLRTAPHSSSDVLSD